MLVVGRCRASVHSSVVTKSWRSLSASQRAVEVVVVVVVVVVVAAAALDVVDVDALVVVVGFGWWMTRLGPPWLG